MAVTLTGTGGIFTRIGKIVKLFRSLNGVRGDTLAVGDVNDTGAAWGASGPTVVDAKTGYDSIAAQYQSTLQFVADGLFSQKKNFRSSIDSAQTYLKQLANTTLIEQVHADAVLPQKSLPLAMAELIRQMKGTSDTVDAGTVTAAVSASGTNVGNATVVASVKGPDGKTREYCFPEVMDFVVTTDHFTGTAGSEIITVKGELAVANTLDYLWPGGSGSSASITVTDPTLDAQTGLGGNLLTNSGFESFTSNIPDDWTLLVGTAGTTVLKTVSVVYGTSSVAALQFTGDGGGTLSSVYQDVSDLVEQSTVYAFNCYVRDSGAGLLAGVLKIDLIDASNTVINDDNAVANSSTVAFGTTTGTYASFSGFFRTPTNLPTTVRLRVSISTGLTNAESMYVDNLALTKAIQLYAGGPYGAAFRASTDVLKNDLWSVTIANNGYAGGTFQTAFEALFGMRSLGLQLPSDSASGETINDSLAF